ncbi:MAG: ABC transporter permease subunit [Candidatus Omnitrophica bacterium]|nr:ABC transporter permease subunit [Candidatus Omnitrophota bacterium]MBD3268827.1 ABC transporter permease subunit [Candidatus Omnitrophota bacterium]
MRTSTIREQGVNFSFVLPALLIFSTFYLYPFFYTFVLSFQRGDGIYFSEFVGLANFQEILFHDKEWWRTMYNGAFITFWALTFQNILAFILALGVDKTIKTGKFYRVVFFILPVLSEIIIGLLMREILISNPGILNQWFERIGLGFLTSNWLGKEKVLLTTALVHCWKGFGWAFVIFLAGLQTIPEQLYEAARIDGANSIQSFCRITAPLLMPVISLVMVLTILGTMQAFAMILALTRGAGGLTEVPVMRIYNHLRGSQVGLACAEGIVLGIILISISYVMFNVSKQIRKRWGVLQN